VIFLKIYGEINGLKTWHKQRLLHFYESGGCSFFPQEKDFLWELASLTEELGKEIGILLDRRGKVHGVILGDHRSISMPRELQELVSQNKLGFLHTHPSGSGRLSKLDETAFEMSDYVWMGALGVKAGKPESFGLMFGTEEHRKNDFWLWEELEGLEVQRGFNLIWEVKKTKNHSHEITIEERVLIVGIDTSAEWSIEESLNELGELVKTAGGQVVGKIFQKRETPENSTFLGQGKILEVLEAIQILNVNTVVFDDELTGVQQRNLENFLNHKVIDRTALILDIFSQRAKSYEGKIQVELALLQYRLTRLTGRGISMSRLGGGIGTRGPGETKLEVDRRRIHQRISFLERKIKEIQEQRKSRRKNRSDQEIPVAALVGYTNSGKSTLLNQLTGAGVLAEDKLFATLDPTIRQFEFSSGRKILISDTVGFINKLPHKLVHAFKATLEEVSESSLILLVIDASDSNWEKKQDAVQKVLNEIGLAEKERIILFNKADQMKDSKILDKYLRQGNCFLISAVEGTGITGFLEFLEGTLFQCWQKKKYLFSYQEGEFLNALYQIGRVYKVEYLEDGILVSSEIPGQYEAKWKKWERR